MHIKADVQSYQNQECSESWYKTFKISYKCQILRWLLFLMPKGKGYVLYWLDLGLIINICLFTIENDLIGKWMCFVGKLFIHRVLENWIIGDPFFKQ